jgi:hypothetical protein
MEVRDFLIDFFYLDYEDLIIFLLIKFDLIKLKMCFWKEKKFGARFSVF